MSTNLDIRGDEAREKVNIAYGIVNAVEGYVQDERRSICPQLILSKDIFIRVRHVQESILILVCFINGVEHRRGGRKLSINEQENRFLSRKLQSLANDVQKLATSQIRRYQIFLLVDVLFINKHEGKYIGIIMTS